MPTFLMTPSGLRSLLALCLLVPLGFYLLRAKEKSAGTRWLLVLIGALLLMVGFDFLLQWIYLGRSPGGGFIPNPPPGSWLDWRAVFFRLSAFGLVMSSWAFLQFAYVFLEQPFPREARIVRWVTTVVLVAAFGMLLGAYFVPSLMGPIGTSIVPLQVVMLAWSVVVLLRKRRRKIRQDGDGREARAYRFYALLSVLPALFIVLTIFPGVFQFFLPAASVVIAELGILVFFFGLIVGHVNYAPEPTTFQAKLVGLALVAVLGVLATVLFVLFPAEGNWNVTPVETSRAMRFVPDARGDGYRIERVPFVYADARGEALDLDDDTNAPVALPFAFPLAGTQWDTMHVNANGVVVFGGPLNTTYGGVVRNGLYDPQYFYDARPKIAPLHADLDPSAGGGVFVASDSSRVVVSWHDVPRFGHPEALNRVQLVLYPDGRFDLVYADVNIPYGQGMLGLRGVVGGGDTPDLATTSWDDSETETLVWTQGAGIVEDFDMARRLVVHDELADLGWIVVGATLFVVIVFPFFFRTSLARPLGRLLDGVRRVDEGELDTRVDVGINDEIGYLTGRFNAMTASLRRYTSEMETLVAERTAQLRAKNDELAQTLGELRQAQAQLVQQEKLASLGALTAGIAHEIKNPLNFVTNFAALSGELVQELRQESDPDEIRALLADLEVNTGKIEEHGRRADAIVRSMMEHARGGEGRRETVDLNALVAEYVDLAYHGKRAQVPDFNADLETTLDDTVGTVEVMPQEIGRVVLNLVGNAFDAVADRAARENGAYRPAVRVSTHRAKDRVEVRVADNGPGIPDDVRTRIFEPFFTTKPTGKGTGLGLSLSHDIVTSGHGGTLTVEDGPGEGTSFVVTLPAG